MSWLRMMAGESRGAFPADQHEEEHSGLSGSAGGMAPLGCRRRRHRRHCRPPVSPKVEKAYPWLML